MATDDDRRLDEELHRLARDASERHRESINPADVDAALAAVRSVPDGGTRRDIVGLKRTKWMFMAAAATVAIFATGVAWWSIGDSDDRLTSVSGTIVDDGPLIKPDESDQLQPSTTPSPEAASTTTTLVDLPSVVLDIEGNEIATFRLVDGQPVIEPAATAFTETLLDYLLNRSTILGATISARSDALFQGGLRIRTTLDPEHQRAAEQARNELPENSAGIDAAIVAIETTTGAVRAIVSGDESNPTHSNINMAITPRPTGSAVETFILAAALQAGALPDDLIDGQRGCVLPGPWTDEMGDALPYFRINGGVAGFIGPLRDMVASSVPCAAARLSHIVGLDRVVDTTYRLAESPYLFPGQSPNVRQPIEPVPDLGVGVNPMSPLDMASGMQTIANVGVHEEPYFVEFVDDPDGVRRYTHQSAATRLLEADVALDAVDVLRGPIARGTARRHPLADDRPAIGKTGTNQGNTDAWFVGATPQLTTAVWVGDPTASIPMVNITEFRELGVSGVQGGMFPAQIWKAFTDAALAGEPIQDWEAPPARERSYARLVLPGFECVFLDGGERVVLGLDDVQPSGTDPTSSLPSVEPDTLVEGCNPESPTESGSTSETWPPIGVDDSVGRADVGPCTVLNEDTIIFEVTNSSSRPSSYHVFVDFLDDAGTRIRGETIMFDLLRAGETARQQQIVFGTYGGTNCEVTAVNRFTVESPDDVAEATCEATGVEFIETELVATNDSSTTSSYYIIAVITRDGVRVGSSAAVISDVEPGASTSGEGIGTTPGPAEGTSCEVVYVDRNDSLD